MMKTRYLYGLITSVILAGGMVACSDNYNTELMPTETAITLVAQIDGVDLKKLDFSAVPQDTTISVVSNTRWSVDVTEGGWCSVNVLSGRGNENIKLSVLENMTKDRNCDVILYKLDADGERIQDGKWTIAISQQSSDVKLSPSSIEPFGPQPLKGQDFEIVANVDWTFTVVYERPDVRFIDLQPKSGMTEIGEDHYSGNGNASFSITLQNNGTAAARKATLELKSAAGSYSVEIIQQKSENTFDVSPNNTRYVDPQGEEIVFSVLSYDGWKVSTAQESWISFSETGSDMGDESRVSIKAFIAPNTDGRTRRGVIRFTPDKEGYVPVDVEIVQNGYNLDFSCSLSNGEDPVSAAGGVLSYSLDSRFDWKTSAPDWISVNPGSGVASDERQTIEMEVAVNKTYSSRTDSITIIPIATGFNGGVSLEPSKVGVYPIKIGIRQDPVQDAAISVPWLKDGYSDTLATIMFNYYSPFVAVVEAGIQWREEDASEWNEVSTAVSDPTEGTVSFELKLLQALTRYVARGYVKYADNKTTYGTVSYPFTSAGEYPEGGHNPAPTR